MKSVVVLMIFAAKRWALSLMQLREVPNGSHAAEMGLDVVRWLLWTNVGGHGGVDIPALEDLYYDEDGAVGGDQYRDSQDNCVLKLAVRGRC